MNKNSKIYIAGHTGLVGGAIVNKLKKDGYSNLLFQTRNELDLLNQNDVYSFLKKEKPNHIILCAAKVGGIKANIDSPADFLYENLQIQNNVIWGAYIAGINNLLFLGSSCIYPRNSQQPMKEEYLLSGKPEPTNEGYALAKITGIKLCEKINTQYNKNYISCMPTNIYGPGDNFNPETSHVIPGLIRRIEEAKQNNAPEVIIWGTGESRREFLYVEDLADACVWLLNNYTQKEYLNIGTGEDISIKELAYIIKDITGYQGKFIFDITKPDGMPKKLLDVSKLNKLGWNYSTDLSKGLQKTYHYFLQTNS